MVGPAASWKGAGFQHSPWAAPHSGSGLGKGPQAIASCVCLLFCHSSLLPGRKRKSWAPLMGCSSMRSWGLPVPWVPVPCCLLTTPGPSGTSDLLAGHLADALAILAGPGLALEVTDACPPPKGTRILRGLPAPHSSCLKIWPEVHLGLQSYSLLGPVCAGGPEGGRSKPPVGPDDCSSWLVFVVLAGTPSVTYGDLLPMRVALAEPHRS